MRVSARVTISGVVQGVGFRYFCCRRAEEYNVTGWVRNRPDNSVEVLAQGEPNLVEQFISQLRRGPASAIVKDVRVTYDDNAEIHDRFEIRRY